MPTVFLLAERIGETAPHAQLEALQDLATIAPHTPQLHFVHYVLCAQRGDAHAALDSLQYARTDKCVLHVPRILTARFIFFHAQPLL